LLLCEERWVQVIDDIAQHPHFRSDQFSQVHMPLLNLNETEFAQMAAVATLRLLTEALAFAIGFVYAADDNVLQVKLAGLAQESQVSKHLDVVHIEVFACAGAHHQFWNFNLDIPIK